MDTIWKEQWDNFEQVHFMISTISDKTNFKNTCVGRVYLSKYDTHIVLQGMYVQQEYRNQKYGTRLVSKAIEIYDSMETDLPLYLQVRIDNEQAIKMYEKFGFIKTDDEIITRDKFEYIWMKLNKINN